MPETKDIIPKLEIEKARNALDEAKILFDSEKYYGAANRSYYAAFHAMSALLIHDGYSMKKHSGVISKFRELYIKTGVFETEMSDGGFEDNKLVFNVKDIEYGLSDADNLKEEFFGIMSDALNNQGDDSLVMDAENYTISVDFTSIMQYACDEAEQAVETYSGTHYDLETYFAMSNLTFEIIGSSREDDGQMKLSLIEPVDY